MKKYLAYIIKQLNLIRIKYRTNSIISKKANITISTKLEGKNKINDNVELLSCKVGFATYIGANTKMYKCLIGKYCSIGENVKVIIGKHPTNKFISTHPSFFSVKKQSGFTYVSKSKFDEVTLLKSGNCVEIGNDVWIGEGVKIMAGIKIGDGAIVGTGSIVTKDIEPYSINAGVPSKFIGYRFERDEIEFLLDYKWWDKDELWIKNNVYLFEDINYFKEKLRGKYNE